MTIDSKNEFLFSACLFFRSVHNKNPTESDIWEESIILLTADSESLAMERAANIGRGRACSYAVEDGDIVTVEFVSVERVFKIDDSLTDAGVEIFSRHLRGSEAKSLLEPFPENNE